MSQKYNDILEKIDEDLLKDGFSKVYLKKSNELLEKFLDIENNYKNLWYFKGANYYLTIFTRKKRLEDLIRLRDEVSKKKNQTMVDRINNLITDTQRLIFGGEEVLKKWTRETEIETRKKLDVIDDKLDKVLIKECDRIYKK